MGFVALFCLVLSPILFVWGDDNATDHFPSYRPLEAELIEWLIRRCSINQPFPPGIESGPLNLDVILDLYHFYGLSVKEEEFSVLVDLRVTWTHPCITWDNTTKFASISQISTPPTMIWRPILQHMNSMDDINSLNKLGIDTTVYISSDGTVTWEPMGRLSSSCPLRLTTFPFDTQTCELSVESWESTDRVNFTNVTMIFFEKYRIMDEDHIWKLVAWSSSLKNMSYNSDPSNYSRAVFSISLKRAYLYYVGSVILPASALNILQLATLILEPKLSDRPVFSINVVLAMAVLMTFVSTIIPQTSQVVLLSVFLSCQFILGLFITLYVIITCTMARSKLFNREVEVKLFRRTFCIRSIRLIDATVGGIAITLTVLMNTVIYSMQLTT